MDSKEILKHARTILLIDWPSKDVPETLTRAGFRVFVHGGPGPDDYSVYEFDGSEIVSRRTGRPPDQADLVYSYRPLAELAQTIDQANAVAAKFLWMQSGLSPDGKNDPRGCWMAEEDSKSAKRQVQAAGLQLITEPYIPDVAREISGTE
jgi:predicted CoA-binding protein